MMNKGQERQTDAFGRVPRYEDENLVERNVRRTEYAIKRFDEEGIRYVRPSQDSDRFIVFGADNNRKYQFYAGTGLILGPYEDRGIENMVRVAKKGAAFR